MKQNLGLIRSEKPRGAGFISLNPAIYYPGTNCTLSNGTVLSGNCTTLAHTDLRRKLALVNPTEGRGIGRMSEYVFGGTQGYNGMLLSLQHRPQRGVAVTGNCTLARRIGVSLGADEGGMCAGSLALPRIIGPHQAPLRIYALLEMGIAVSALMLLMAVP